MSTFCICTNRPNLKAPLSKGSRRRQATEGLFMVSSFSYAEKEAKRHRWLLPRLCPEPRNAFLVSGEALPRRARNAFLAWEKTNARFLIVGTDVLGCPKKTATGNCSHHKLIRAMGRPTHTAIDKLRSAMLCKKRLNCLKNKIYTLLILNCRNLFDKSRGGV